MNKPIAQDVLRASVKRIASNAQFVRCEEDKLHAYIGELAKRDEQERHDPEPVEGSSFDDRIAFVLLRDATNFGSGWHPHLNKEPGLSGARTTGVRLSRWLTQNGVPTAEWLRSVTAEDAAIVFGQSLKEPVNQLMALFAEAWRQLGETLYSTYSGSYTGLVESAERSAVSLAATLGRIGHFNDAYELDGLALPFLKRAQLATYDLHMFCGDHPACRFDDLDRLTIFADNLGPHTLKVDGVLVFDDDLETRIEAGENIEAGSREEIEIRAMAVYATERLAELSVGNGDTVYPLQISDWLWNRGQAPKYKARPRQRTRSVHY